MEKNLYIARFIYDDIVYKFKADQIKLSFEQTQLELWIYIFLLRKTICGDSERKGDGERET